MQKSEVNKRTFRSRIRSDLGSDLVTLGTLAIIIFDILEPPAVQRYSICWVFLALCVFVNLYLCI